MIHIVLGAFFGDEGKGQIVHNLSDSNSIIVRFSGGSQSGHTVISGNKKHVFSNFGSGTFKGCPTYWSEYCFVNPLSAIVESKILLEKFNVTPKVIYNPLCQVITPMDISFQRKDKDNLKHGTVGTGYWPAIKRVRECCSLTVEECQNKKVLLSKLNSILEYYNETCVNIEELAESYINWFKRNKIGFLKPSFSNIIFEGSQGILLDQKFGFYPHTTPSNTTGENAYKIIKSIGVKDIIVNYVSRIYITRHGNGPILSEPLENIVNPEEINVYNKFQGSLKYAKLDLDLLNHSINCNRIITEKESINVSSKICFTCWDLKDQLTYINNLKECSFSDLQPIYSKFRGIELSMFNRDKEIM